MKKFGILVVLAMFVALSASSVSAKPVGERIKDELSQYAWYPILEDYNYGPNQDYNLRFEIVLYLESKGIYKVYDTKYCQGGGCYIGTANQNVQLLRQLRKTEVRKLLNKIGDNQIPDFMEKWRKKFRG